MLLALGGTFMLHGALVALGLRFDLTPGSTSLSLYLAGLACPALAAIALAGKAGRKNLLCALGAISGQGGTIAAALLAQPLMIVAANLLARGEAMAFQPMPGMLLLALGQLIVVLGEEPGWRFYLLPRLNRKLGLRGGVLAMAAIWGIWHAPMFFVAGSLQSGSSPLFFAAQIFGWSALHAALYLRAQGSLVPHLVLHAGANLALSLGLLVPGAENMLMAVSLVTGGVVVLALPLFQSRV
ncbi:MAG TPA: CPBP family intramembrane metalloprotease [Micropepsaceae bacterium]|nr:CPBP family intramembrane metalloprotease [Micropepsaceae bacterium]